MRGDSGKRFIFLLSGMLLIFMLFGQGFYVKAEKKSEPKTTLVIGDSIPYGMALGKKRGTGVDKADKVYWLTEGGVNINLLHPDFKINLGKVMPRAVVNTLTFSKKFDLIKEVKKKKIEDIVVILGANWPGEKSAELIVSTLKKLAKKSGCRVYYVNTLPYVHKGIYKNRTTVMTYHNKMTKEGFKNTDIRYIDAYNLAKSVKNYQNFTSDGIHYSKQVYNVVFEGVLTAIENEKAAEKLSEEKETEKLSKEKKKKKIIKEKREKEVNK